MRDLREVQLEAFRDELQKHGSKWYANVAKGLGNFAKRQVHAVSGWTPHGFHDVHGIEAIGAGAANARERLAKAVVGTDAHTLAQKAVEANERAQSMGLTSIPGFAKSLVSSDPNKGVANTLRAGFEQQWHGTTTGEKALMLGLPLAATGAAAVMPDDPEHPHKGRDIGAGIVSTAAGMVTGGIPLATGMVVGEGASRVGGAVGGAVDKIRKRRRENMTGHIQAPPAPEEARGQHVPTERVVSPAAAGQMPEGIT